MVGGYERTLLTFALGLGFVMAVLAFGMWNRVNSLESEIGTLRQQVAEDRTEAEASYLTRDEYASIQAELISSFRAQLGGKLQRPVGLCSTGDVLYWSVLDQVKCGDR